MFPGSNACSEAEQPGIKDPHGASNSKTIDSLTADLTVTPGRLCRLQGKLPRLPITDYWHAADMSFANGSNRTPTLETAIYGD